MREDEYEKRRAKRQQECYRRKRRQKIVRRRIYCGIAAVFVLCVGLCLFARFYGSNQSSEEQLATEEQGAVGSSEEVTELVLNYEEEEVVEEEVDVRTVQNTATEESHKTNGLAICMYHFVYQEENRPEYVDNNYIEQNALREEFQYLVDNEYYFPTWEEVRQYVDGTLLLPEKSVVLTFDDADLSFLELGIPVAEEVGVPVTSFVITSSDGPNKVETYASPYVDFESHTHDMHKAGGTIGHGGIFTALSVEDAVTDLQTSIEICGNGDALAYPFGDYNDSSIEATKEAGFLCAVTTEYGRVYPGDDPYLLSRVRMLEGQSLASFISCVE